MGPDYPPSYRPNESAETIFAEHTWLQGAFLGAVAYGIQFVLYVMTTYFLWKFRARKYKQNLFLIVYISIIFLLSTLYTVGLLQFTQEAFIDGRNIPGGPAAFENEMFSLPIDMLANVIMVLNSWFCDIINVWRCFVIYQGCRVPAWLVNTVPILLYLGSVAFGILFLKQVGTVSQSPWDAAGINFTIPYYSMSLALNILVTILIVMRLLIYRHRIVRAMGSGHGSHYTSLVAIVVESAAIYSSFAILFLIPFALNSQVAQLFLQSLSLVQGVSTFLIIFRVATGKGWSQDTHSVPLSTLAAATIGGMPISKFRSKKKGHSTTSNVLSTYKDGEETGEEPIVLGTITSSTATDYNSQKNADGVEVSKHVYVGESV